MTKRTFLPMGVMMIVGMGMFVHCVAAEAATSGTIHYEAGVISEMSDSKGLTDGTREAPAESEGSVLGASDSNDPRGIPGGNAFILLAILIGGLVFGIILAAVGERRGAQ